MKPGNSQHGWKCAKSSRIFLRDERVVRPIARSFTQGRFFYGLVTYTATTPAKGGVIEAAQVTAARVRGKASFSEGGGAQRRRE